MSATGPAESIEEAVRRCGVAAPPGKVVAELGFGFWRYLTSSAYEKRLSARSCTPHIHRDGEVGR